MPRLCLNQTTYQLKKQILPKRTIKTIDLALPDIHALTDDTIIYLNNLFMSAGFHTILVATQQQGRELLGTFLASLNYYSYIGCLSSDAYQLPEWTNEIGYLFSSEHDLECMLTESFYYDFIWIEETKEQIKKAQLLKQKLKDLGIDQQVPIVSVLYMK